MSDIEYDEVRALDARDEIQQVTGLDLTIFWEARKRKWLAGLNNPGALPNEFDSVDEAISWAYWYAYA